MNVNDRLVRWLDELGIRYRTLEHPPTRTSEDSARVRGEALSKGAKAIVMKIDEEMVMLVFPAERKVHSSSLKQLLKSQGLRAKRIRFATPDELMERTGLLPGSVPPFGEPILPFKLYVDAHLFDQEEIAFNAGSLTNSVFMGSDDYRKICGGQLGGFTQPVSI